MNRLFRVLHRWKCKTAAQKSALDGIRILAENNSRGARALLWHVEGYLRGVNAPETGFRDFTNHVLYPVEHWGGAARLARKWYWSTVEALRSREWSEAAFNAGVVARYATFACSIPRTGHEDKAVALQWPYEWTLFREYDELIKAIDGSSSLNVPDGQEWLERLVIDGAEAAHCHFHLLIDRFEMNSLLDDPLGNELRAAASALLMRSAATVAAILDRTLTESAADPPRYPLGLASACTVPARPFFWMGYSLNAGRQRRVARVMQREFQEHGRIEESLPEESRAIRDAYEIEVLKKPKLDRRPVKAEPKSPPARSVPSRPQPAPRRPLGLHSPVDEAPSVEAKLAAKLNAAGVNTIGKLLEADPEEVAGALHPDATAADVATWQDEARLCCEIATLSPVEAQLLVACGVTGRDDLAALSPVELWELVVPVSESPDGRRLLRGAAAPDLDAVTGWINAAKRPAQAA